MGDYIVMGIVGILVLVMSVLLKLFIMGLHIHFQCINMEFEKSKDIAQQPIR